MSGVLPLKLPDSKLGDPGSILGLVRSAYFLGIIFAFNKLNYFINLMLVKNETSQSRARNIEKLKLKYIDHTKNLYKCVMCYMLVCSSWLFMNIMNIDDSLLRRIFIQKITKKLIRETLLGHCVTDWKNINYERKNFILMIFRYFQSRYTILGTFGIN